MVMAASEKSGKGDSRRPFLKKMSHITKLGRGDNRKTPPPPAPQAGICHASCHSEPEATKGLLTLLSQYSLC